MKDLIMKSTLLILALAFPLSGCTPNTDSPKANTVTAVSPVVQQTPTPPVSAADVAPPDSIYTGLDEKSCKETTPGPNDSGAIYKAECPGAGGYKVILMASDHSQALTFVDKTGKATDLRVRDGLNTDSSFRLGDKIEWRMEGKGSAAVAQAFIVRALKSVDPIDPDKRESNMIVGKLAGTPCITDIVGPSVADQNTRARELAATAKGRPCVPKMR